MRKRGYLKALQHTAAEAKDNLQKESHKLLKKSYRILAKPARHIPKDPMEVKQYVRRAKLQNMPSHAIKPSCCTGFKNRAQQDLVPKVHKTHAHACTEALPVLLGRECIVALHEKPGKSSKRT